MEENIESTAAEQTESESWDDIDLSDLTDDAAESAAEGEAPADQPEEAQAKDEPETQAEGQEAPQADQFELKHLDETRKVGRDEVIALAQKGMDYDRVREKYDNAKESIEWYGKNADSVHWLEEIAKEQGMTFEELVDSTRAQIMANKTNQSLAVCRGIVANERKALQLEAQKKAIEAKTAESDKKNDRMQQEVKAFAAEYKDVAEHPDSIPKEVWDAVHKGETLLNAYRAYENKQLRTEIEKLKQEQKNKARSTGSQSTAGKRTQMDDFDAAWYDGT